jgi:phosphohistidine swiveling domain-containing protein
MLEQKDRSLAAQFAKDYKFFVHFGGLRETHKYYLVFSGGLVRKKIIAIAKEFVAAGRLDNIEQIFDLSLEQLDQSRVDSSLDLRALAASNTTLIKKLARVSNPPALIDSRGFIPRPKRAVMQEGMQVGIAISPGVVRGRIKTLRTPDEKPFEKGEILVARATDPGWTPLFLNAAGVILEVGGVLQHGALVAREYGLPCVAGIEHATSLWQDGMTVEIDGSAGTVRTITD